MRELETVIYVVVGVAVTDWVLVGRLAALFTDFEYRYWPPSWPRVATLAMVTTTAAVSAVAFTPGEMPHWPLLIWMVVFGLWMIVAVDDIGRQRALGR